MYTFLQPTEQLGLHGGISFRLTWPLGTMNGKRRGKGGWGSAPEDYLRNPRGGNWQHTRLRVQLGVNGAVL